MRKWLSPHSVIYLVLHGFLIIIGVLIFHSFRNDSLASFFQPFGISLTAAGSAGYVIFIYVKATDRLKSGIEIINNFGLTNIFERRQAAIKSEYDTRLEKAKDRIDVIGFGLAAMGEDYKDEFDKWQQRAKVRILIIDPEFPSSEFSYASQRDSEENNTSDRIKRDAEKFISIVQPILSERFQVRKFQCLPSVNIFRIDSEILWGHVKLQINPTQSMHLNLTHAVDLGDTARFKDALWLRLYVG